MPSRAVHLSLLLTFLSGLCDLHAAELEVGLNFMGTTFLQAGRTPPNASGAIGRDHFVEFVNGRYAVYDAANGSTVASSGDLGFWAASGIMLAPNLNVSDPRVIFDPTTERWFASGIDLDYATWGENRFLLAVSKTANPLDGWSGVAFDADPGAAHFSDFARLGMDANGVYVAVNLFNLGATELEGQTVAAIPKADLLGATPSVANLTSFGNLSSATRGFSVMPVIHFSAASVEAHVLALGPIISSSMKDSTITGIGEPGGPVLNSPGSTPIPAYSRAPSLRQPDGTVSVFNLDLRLGANVYQVGNVIYAAHATRVSEASAIRWYRLDADTGALLESGTFAEADVDYSFPAIAANEKGAIVIGFNKSSDTEFISSYEMLGETVNGVTTFGAPLLLAAGTANYHYMPNANGISRWGDFSTTTVDPDDPNVFWTSQEIAIGQNVWATQITQLRVVPEPAVSVLLAIGVLLTDRRRRPR